MRAARLSAAEEASDGMLLLPHVQDASFQTNQEGDPLKVNCLDISPVGDIIVTGCEDGVARVWRFGDRGSRDQEDKGNKEAEPLQEGRGSARIRQKPAEAHLLRMQQVLLTLVLILKSYP